MYIEPSKLSCIENNTPYVRSLAHARMMEDQPITTTDILVLPTSFGEALLGGLGDKSSVTAITRASQRVSRYHERFWRSRLVLIPLQHQRHWILAAVVNPHLARDSSLERLPMHVANKRDTRPDVSPFCVLIFNSQQKACAVGPIVELLKDFMRYLWSVIHGGVLEYLDAHNVKVRRSPLPRTFINSMSHSL